MLKNIFDPKVQIELYLRSLLRDIVMLAHQVPGELPETAHREEEP